MKTVARRRLSAVLGLALVGWTGPALMGADEKPVVEQEVYDLPPMRVKGEAQCSYGMSLTLIRDPVNRRVVQIFVAKVHEKSSAANFGLKAGDEILAINGEKVRGMTGELKRGSRLFDLLINRPVGDTIEVEVMAGKLRRLTLKVVPPALTDISVPRLGW